MIEKENDYQHEEDHMEITMAKTKDKERLLKATRKGEATNNKVENTHKAINRLFSRNSAEQNTVA